MVAALSHESLSEMDRTDLIELVEDLQEELAESNQEIELANEIARDICHGGNAARIAREAMKELAALKGGMIQRVGQRFIAANGFVMVVVAFRESYDDYSWVLRDERYGLDSYYRSDGKTSTGESTWNLVGPAPDAEELAQLKADNVRLLAELKALKRQSTLSQAGFDKIAQNADWLTNEDDLRTLIRGVAETEIRTLQRNEQVYVAVAIPKRVDLSLDCCGIHDIEAVRIESPDGEAVLFEVRVK